jgi:SAM-dependent methyltransferase
MSTMSQRHNVFEFLGSQRKEVSVSQDELERIGLTRAMIPNNVQSILDVGCGDGRILEELSPKYKAVGIDYAFSSVRQVNRGAVQGSSSQLPFSDRSFDLVLCCEVLEHLDQQLFLATITELIRVTRRYVLISVPYKENLRRLLTKCQQCHAVFHIWGHVRSLSSGDLDKKFVPFKAVSTQFSGKRPPYFNPIILWCNQQIGNRWTEFAPTTMCPCCGNTQFKATGRNSVTLACGLLNLITSKAIPTSKRNWILKLYER